MSDHNRKSVSEQVTERMTPNSEKTVFERVKETVTDTVDKGKAMLTPQSEKSTSQTVTDRVRGSVDTDHTHKSTFQKVKEGFNSGVEEVKKSVE